MNYSEYKNLISKIPETRGLGYEIAFMWLNPGRLPIGVVSLNGCTDKVIRVPTEEVNPHSGGKNTVPVIAIGQEAFKNNTGITDVILSGNITKIGDGAFSGCTSLERITLPKGIKRIGENTFAGCTKLRDIYYEGTLEEWNSIDIFGEKYEYDLGPLIPGTPVQSIIAERLVHRPGNEALKLANIHLRCELPNVQNTKQFFLHTGKRDITQLFEQKL